MKKRLKGKLYQLDDKGQKWQAVVHTGWDPEKKRYTQVRRTFNGSNSDAQVFLRDLINELEEEPYQWSMQPLGEWLDYWLEAFGRVVYKWEQNTYDRNKRVVTKNIKPYMGKIPLAEIEPSHVLELYAYLGTKGKTKQVKTEDGKKGKIKVPLSARTVRYAHVLLNQALKEAVKLKKIPENPAKGLTPKEEKRKAYKKWVVPEAPQLKEFLEGCCHHQDYALIFTAAYSGARQSELLGLEKDAILWDKSSIYIKKTLHIDHAAEDGYEHRDRTKNETSERIIKLPQAAMQVLAAQIAAQEAKGIKSKLVFTGEDGKPINRDNLGHRFSNLAKRLGYPGMTFHHLRHTHITILLSNGAYINQVSQRAGHADPSITLKVYGHCLPKGDDILASMFSDLLKPDNDL